MTASGTAKTVRLFEPSRPSITSVLKKSVEPIIVNVLGYIAKLSGTLLQNSVFAVYSVTD
jgi:hypothetical protein